MSEREFVFPSGSDTTVFIRTSTIMGLLFFAITGCLLLEPGDISLISEIEPPTNQTDSGQPETTDTGEQNESIDFSQRWAQAQWLNLENDTAFWARLSAMQLLKSTSIPIQTVLNPLSDCGGSHAFDPNSLVFDGSCTLGTVTTSGSIRAISGVIEYKDVLVRQAVQELSPAYVNCSGFIEMIYNGIAEQSEFNAPSAQLRMHILTLADSSGPSYCPRYELELWFRSDVSGPSPFSPTLIGAFSGSGEVVARLQQAGDSSDGKAFFLSELEMDEERCPYEALSGSTQISSDQTQLNVYYNGEDSCDALQTSDTTLGVESSEMTRIGY